MLGCVLRSVGDDTAMTSRKLNPHAVRLVPLVIRRDDCLPGADEPCLCEEWDTDYQHVIVRRTALLRLELPHSRFVNVSSCRFQVAHSPG